MMYKLMMCLFLSLVMNTSFAGTHNAVNIKPVEVKSLFGQRLWLKDGGCAGFDFSKNGKYINYNNELDCNFSVEAPETYRKYRLKILSKNTFELVDLEPVNDKDKALRNVYKLLKIKGKQVYLYDISDDSYGAKREILHYRLD